MIVLFVQKFGVVPDLLSPDADFVHQPLYLIVRRAHFGETLFIPRHGEKDVDAELPGVDEALCLRTRLSRFTQHTLAFRKEFPLVQHFQSLLGVPFLKVAVSGATFYIHHPALGAYLLADVEDVGEQLLCLLFQTRPLRRLSGVLRDDVCGAIRLFELLVKLPTLRV